jgi:hypothetical protein
MSEGGQRRSPEPLDAEVGVEERVTPVPAPWRLQGHGYGLLYRRLPRSAVDVRGVLPEALRDRFVGGTAALVVASYDSSDVGAYRELLFVPGRFQHGESSFYSITRGFVSSSAPATSGRLNWGLPRQVARIDFERVGVDERVTVRRKGRTLVALTFRAGRFGLPATTDVIPASSRTIMQTAGELTLFTTVGGRGTLKRARLLEASLGAEELPDLSAHHPSVVVRLESFHLALPRPRIVDLHHEAS